MEALDLNLALPLPWQAELWARLQRQREAGQLPHALLLAGPSGVGKRRFAAALSAALLCQSPERGIACGRCRTCGLMTAGTHPDWTWLTPEEKGKAIKIDWVRELVLSMAQTAQQGGLKLAVLEPAEAMNRNAANALLKTLEEPSGATVLMLISDSPARLLPTIRSRCQRLDFPVPPLAAARAWLAPIAGSAARLDAAMDEAGQRPLLARQLLEADGLERRQALAAALSALLAGETTPLALAERWQEADWDDLLDWLKARVGAALRCRSSNEAPVDAAVAQLARIESPRLFAWFDRLQGVHQHSRAG
ncbi:MAG: DNA polymerase III subunit delta', partial [Spongiibacteraceae bacterium]